MVKWIEEIGKRVENCNTDSISSMKDTIDAIRQVLFYARGNVPHPSEMKTVYPTTYLLMKSGPCAYACKHDGDCDKCKEYGDIRKQAARDHDELMRLRKLEELVNSRK